MNNGIQPTVELATNNGNAGFAYPYPVYPMMSGFGGGSGFGSGFGGDSGWIILLLLLAFSGNWGNNNGGGFFSGNSFDNGYAWLSNGQKDIMNQTSDGFNSLHLSNQVEGIRDDVNDIQMAICNSTASINNNLSNVNSNISNGFYNAEIAAGNRNTNMLQALNGINTSLLNCCCENRLASCQTQNAIVSEAAATRFADANNTRDIITSQTSGTQAILDKLCQLELDNVKSQVEAKNDRIAELQSQLNMANLAASQTAQTAQLRLSEEQQFESFYNRLKNCPVNAVAVYGNTPVFTCPGNNNGCGCNGFNTTSQFI